MSRTWLLHISIPFSENSCFDNFLLQFDCWFPFCMLYMEHGFEKQSFSSLTLSHSPPPSLSLSACKDLSSVSLGINELWPCTIQTSERLRASSKFQHLRVSWNCCVYSILMLFKKYVPFWAGRHAVTWTIAQASILAMPLYWACRYHTCACVLEYSYFCLGSPRC